MPLHKSKEFGMGLLSDRNIVGDIIGRCGDNLMRANTEVLQAWLDGKGGNVNVALFADHIGYNRLS